MIAIETKNLSKSFGRKLAVDHVSLAVEQGEIYGFLGNNGAGKSTTIKMLTGLVAPDSGAVRLLGKDMRKAGLDIMPYVGCMIETPGAFGNLTAFENLEISFRSRGASKKRTITDTMELVGLDSKDRTLVRGYSLGMRQRLGIARALLNKPEILILDEPTSGLDPSGIRDMRHLLRRLAKEQRMTLFLSSHILTEVEQLADRVGIIHHGKLIDEISMEGLRERSSEYIEIEVDRPAETLRFLETELGIFDFSVTGENRIEIYDLHDQAALINKMLVANRIEVRQIIRQSMNLERHFIELTGGERRV